MSAYENDVIVMVIGSWDIETIDSILKEYQVCAGTHKTGQISDFATRLLTSPY